MYLDIIDIPSSLVISGNTFENNTITYYDKRGYDIIVSSFFLSYVVTSSTFSFLKKKDDDDVSALGEYWTTNGYFEVNLVSLVKGLLNEKNVYFGDGGDFSNNCTNNSTDLCSGFHPLEVRYVFSNDTTVHIVKNLTVRTDYDFKYVTRKVVGDGDDVTLLFANSSFLNFYSGTTFEDLFIIISSGILRNRSLLDFYYGEFKFSDVNFSSGLYSVYHSIFLLSYFSKLTLKDCTFSGVRYSSNGGPFAAFEWYIYDDNIYSFFIDPSIVIPELYMEGCTFDKCKKVGNGGAMYIPSTALHLRVGTNGNATTFNGCSAEYGGAIYYKLISFDDYVFEKLIFGTGTENENKATKKYGDRILIISDIIELDDFGKIFPSIKGETKVDHQHNCVFKFDEDESEQIYYSLIDVINGNAKEGEGDKFVGNEGSDENRNCTNNAGDL